MAENSGRGNTIDAVDGPKGGNANPPPVSDTVKDSVKESSRPEMEGGGGTNTFFYSLYYYYYFNK
ncbi:hypothetical protein GGR50DRAFT_657093 [Xylaria sp. CBS 124048]|nr:hypothetical protein GGR50DRAFT_657093 [Xylaria sp. CBS 124048]